MYGPVPSWRLGRSLGIDPLSQERKVCTFDCVYCQLGPARCSAAERKTFVPADSVMEEIAVMPPVDIDYITFSGTGEPTLAANLGEMIRRVRRSRPEKIAVLTNASLIGRKDVRDDLSLADLVVCKFDAPSRVIFERVNRPAKGIRIDGIIHALKEFRGLYRGRLALQTMFVEENRSQADGIARAAREIGPDEVQLNTPLRPSAARPLPADEMASIEGHFGGLSTVSVYRAETKDVSPISSDDTLKRRGKR